MQISSKEGAHDYFKNKLGSGSGMFSDPDPAPLKQIISDPNGSGPAPQTQAHWNRIGSGNTQELIQSREKKNIYIYK